MRNCDVSHPAAKHGLLRASTGQLRGHGTPVTFRMTNDLPAADVVREDPMSRTTGRHFLQIPGPSAVPDEVLRAMSAPTIDHRGPDFAELGRAVLDGLARSSARPIRWWSTRLGTGAWEAALVNTLSPGTGCSRSRPATSRRCGRRWPARWARGRPRARRLAARRRPGRRRGAAAADPATRSRPSRGPQRDLDRRHEPGRRGAGRHGPRRSPGAPARGHHLLARLDRLPPRRVGGRRDRERLAEGAHAPAGSRLQRGQDKALAAPAADLPTALWDWEPNMRPTRAASSVHTRDQPALRPREAMRCSARRGCRRSSRGISVTPRPPARRSRLGARDPVRGRA